MNLRSKFGNAALVSAAKFGCCSCLGMLIEAGADANATVSGYTALHIAAKESNISCIVQLIQIGADVNIVDNRGQTTLMHLLERSSGLSGLLQLFLDAGADVNLRNSRNRNALYFAARRENPKCVKTLLSAGSEINTSSNCYSVFCNSVESRNAVMLVVAGEGIGVEDFEDWMCQSDIRLTKCNDIGYTVMYKTV